MSEWLIDDRCELVMARVRMRMQVTSDRRRQTVKMHAPLL